MRKTIVLIFIIIAVICSLLLVWYLNRALVSEKIKFLLIGAIEKQTHLSIHIQDLRFHIIRGFELENIKIFNAGLPDEPLLKAGRVWFKPLLIPSLRKIHIVIPALNIRGAYIKIERDKSGNWNFLKPDTSEAKASPTKKERFSLSVLKVSTRGSSVVLNDNFRDRHISETLTDVNANLGLSLPHSLSLSLNGNIYKSPINLKGKISHPFKNPQTALKITTSGFDLKNIKNLADIGIQEGLAKIKADVSLKPEGTSTIKVVTDIKSFKYRKQNLYLVGDFDIDAKLQGDMKAPGLFSYKGNIGFKEATMAFSDVFPLIRDATGEALFIDRSIIIKNFIGNIVDSPVSLSGKLDYSAEFPDININISADEISLNKLIQSLPQTTRAKLKQIDLDGKATLNISLASKKDKPRALSYKGDLKISNANLGCPWLKEKIKDMDCILIFEKDALSWDKLSFKYKNISYISSGTASELEKPLISAVLESEDFKANGVIKIRDDILNIQKLGIAHQNYSLQAKGALKDFKRPIINIEGGADLDLEKAKLLLPKYKDDIEKINPKGLLDATFILNGPLKEPLLWNLQVKAKSDEVILGKFNLGSLYLDFKMEDKFLHLPRVIIRPYDGIVDMAARLNLKSEEKPYLISIDARNIDLKKLISDTKLSKSKIRGLFATNTTLNGYFEDKNSLKGKGWLQISEGYLMEFPIVFQLLDAFLGIPPEYIVLTDAFGNFSISDKRIYTADFRLLSEKAALFWEGSLGLDGTLDFNVTGRFAEDISTKTTSLGKIASAVLHEAGAYIVEARLTGTIDDPQYQIVPSIKRIFDEKVMDKLKDAIGDIF